MIKDYVIFIEGLSDLGDLREIKPEILKAASMAVNKAADRARVRAAKEMRRQVNFPARYLEGQNSRLRVTKRAKPDDPVAIITGRRRPTSLARFATGSRKGRGGGVYVTVKPGRSRFIGRSFLMPLRAGRDELGNVGLAVRTKRGARPRNAYKPVKIAEGLWLLYGPSVDQVFKTVREDIAPDTQEFLAREFARLLNLDIVR